MAIDSGTWSDWAGVFGAAIGFIALGLGEWRAFQQSKRERENEKTAQDHRQEDNDKFERQLKAAKEASEAHISALKQQNALLQQQVNLEQARLEVSTPELLEVTVERQSLSTGGFDILVARIANRSPVTTEIKNIYVDAQSRKLQPIWTTLDNNIPPTSGLPDGMALSTPTEFKLHKGQTAIAYFAKERRGPNAQCCNLYAPNYLTDLYFRCVFQDATRVVVATLSTTFENKNMAPLTAFMSYVQRCVDGTESARTPATDPDSSSANTRAV